MLQNITMLPVTLCLFFAAAVFAGPGGDFTFSEEELQRYFGVSSNENAPEYEIVYPEFVTTDGKRDFDRGAVAASYLEVQVDAFGQALHMTLNHDDSNIKPGLEAEYVTDEGTITVPVRTDCLYTGKVVGEPNSVVSVTTCVGLMAVVHHTGGPTYIEPLDDEHALKRDIGRGLPHVAYKNKAGQVVHCPVTQKSKYVVKSPHVIPDEGPTADFNPEATKKYLELAFIGDSVLYDLRGSNTHTCLTTLFNAVKNVLQLSSLAGTSLVPKLVHVRVFTSTETGLKTCPDRLQSLNRASDWQNSNNYPSTDSRHWDNAAILTGWEMGPENTLGAGWTTEHYIICENRNATSVSTFRDMRSTDVVAHEIGHNLSFQHDGEGNQCPTKGYVMAAKFSGSDPKKELGWSSCSRDYFNKNIGNVKCYDDSS